MKKSIFFSGFEAKPRAIRPETALCSMLQILRRRLENLIDALEEPCMEL
jgi:hypothetical protein